VAANRFGVLYLGTSLKVCFVEAVLRDLRNGAVGDYPIAEADLHARRYAVIEIIEPLNLVDLRDDGPVRMGVPTDVVRGSDQSLARRWSVAFHTHPSGPDGVIYPSRLNNEVNLALYDRAIGKMAAVDKRPLLAATGLGSVLNALKAGLV
jgi:RES domain